MNLKVSIVLSTNGMIIRLINPVFAFWVSSPIVGTYPNIGNELESHTESTDTSTDSGKTNIEGIKKPVLKDEQRNQSTEDTTSTEQTEKEKDDADVKRIS